MARIAARLIRHVIQTKKPAQDHLLGWLFPVPLIIPRRLRIECSWENED